MPSEENFKVPEFRFKFGRLIQDAFAGFRMKIPNAVPVEIPPWEKTKKLLDTRWNLWKENEEKIILGMQKATGLHFYQSTIDVFFVHGWRRAFSEPLVIGFDYEGDLFIDILTHELIHRLLMDNKEKINSNNWAGAEYSAEESLNVINHILVHAVHEEIYTNILQSPDRLQEDKDKCKNFPAYKRAWDIVEEEGYMNIIKKFKESKV